MPSIRYQRINNAEDIFKIGTVAKILKVLQMPDGNTTGIIQGKKRFKIDDLISNLPYLKVKISSIFENNKEKKESEFKLTVESIKETAVKIINENPNIPSDVISINTTTAIVRYVLSRNGIFLQF